MMQNMLEYFYDWVVHCIKTYPISHWHTMIFSTTDYEYGGISEFLYEQYGMTGDTRFFWMAEQFEDEQFLGALYSGRLIRWEPEDILQFDTILLDSGSRNRYRILSIGIL